MEKKMTNITIFITFAFLVIGAVMLFQYTARYAYDYRLEESGISIVLFGKIRLMLIRFENIEEIRKTSYNEVMPFKNNGMLFALRFGNKIWGDIVLISQKKGMNKIILVTPNNADQFIKNVVSRRSEIINKNTSLN
jgi:hypothetical protein